PTRCGELASGLHTSLPTGGRQLAVRTSSMPPGTGGCCSGRNTVRMLRSRYESESLPSVSSRFCTCALAENGPSGPEGSVASAQVPSCTKTCGSRKASVSMRNASDAPSVGVTVGVEVSVPVAVAVLPGGTVNVGVCVGVSVRVDDAVRVGVAVGVAGGAPVAGTGTAGAAGGAPFYAHLLRCVFFHDRGRARKAPAIARRVERVPHLEEGDGPADRAGA